MSALYVHYNYLEIGASNKTHINNDTVAGITAIEIPHQQL